MAKKRKKIGAMEIVHTSPKKWMLQDQRGKQLTNYGGNTWWNDSPDQAIKFDNKNDALELASKYLKSGVWIDKGVMDISVVEYDKNWWKNINGLKNKKTMATKKKANPILKKIVAEAKRIQKAHPAMKWTNAIKDAAKHIKSGAKTIVKKASTAKKKAVSIKKTAKKRVIHAKSAIKHTKKAFGIGNLNNSLIEEIKRANRGIEQCEHQIIGLKERLKTSENKPLIRATIKRMMENKKYYKTILAKAKKQLK